jgi:hypothetical protein
VIQQESVAPGNREVFRGQSGIVPRAKLPNEDAFELQVTEDKNGLLALEGFDEFG